MKSIVFLCDDAREVGGVQRVLATLAREFSRRGYHVVILSLAERAAGGFDYGNAEIGTLFTESRLHRFLQRPALGNLHLRGRRLFRLRPTAYRRAQTKLRNLVDRLRPDAIIVFDTLMAEIATEAHLKDSKIIVQFHNSFASIADGRVISALRRVSGRASAFLALTEEDAEQFDRAGVARATAMPNPVSFYPAAVPYVEDRERRVVAIGRLHPQKDFTMLVEAWATAERPAGWHLDIYGEGFERSAIQDAIERHQLTNSVTLHSPSREVEALLSRAAIFALSSRYEGLCMVALEALACGLPIVSTRSGPGTTQLVKNCGLLSEIGDVHGFAANLTRLMNEPELRRMFSTAGRMKARQYDIDETVTRWQRLIDDLPYAC